MEVGTLFERLRWRFDNLGNAGRRLVIVGLAASAVLLVGGFVLSVYLWRLSRQFPVAPFAQPSRLYGAVPQLVPGGAMSPGEMVADLEVAGYRKAPDAPDTRLPAGTYRQTGDQVAVHLRRFSAPDGPSGGTRVEATFEGDRVADLRVSGKPAKSADLEPPLLATFYDDDLEERRPVTLADLPDPVVKAVLAAEDDGFYTHSGVSPLSIVRAAWTNLRGGRLQGGSTITQQLVKNLYLTNRRTLSRKAEEAMIAMMVEVRHSKRAILEAYLNEIYLGSSGPASLVGLGAAARTYFGKEAAELELEEAATLAGMIKAPGAYSPIAHPGRALERRDWVLRRMADMNWISAERLRQALSQPLRVDSEAVRKRRIAPYFAEAARAEADERFGVDELDGQGYQLFSTLRWRDQRQAETAVAGGLANLEKGWERRPRAKGAKGTLQAALVSVDPREGGILSWVGGRDYAKSQFDRVAQARRQAGSAFKPVIYAAAFAQGAVGPATLFEDSPISVRVGTASWEPKNYDQAFHGRVTARTALARSYNIPTVRVAFQVGLKGVIEQAHALGMSDDLEPHPSLALGAFETNPLELASVYSTFATGGMQPPVHGLVAVLDPEGEPRVDEGLPAPRRALPSQAAYLVTSVLQGVVDGGTGAGEHAMGEGSHLAGKTGTTNDRRDSWFAGYSPDRVTVVWVGYDDNSATQLSGARAALPIWSHFTAAVRPPGGYPPFAVPAGLVTATIDPETGLLATPDCPHAVTEVYPDWEAPTELCPHHAPGFAQATLASLGPGQPALDPATGAPIAAIDRSDPATTATAEALYAIDEDGLQTTLEPGGNGTIVIRHARALPAPGSYDGSATSDPEARPHGDPTDPTNPATATSKRPPRSAKIDGRDPDRP